MNCPCTLLLATTFSAAGPVLVDASVRSAVVLAAAALLTLAMRRASAAERHLVWLLALGSTLALPIFSALLPAWRILPHWPGQAPCRRSNRRRSSCRCRPSPSPPAPRWNPRAFRKRIFKQRSRPRRQIRKSSLRRISNLRGAGRRMANRRMCSGRRRPGGRG